MPSGRSSDSSRCSEIVSPKRRYRPPLQVPIAVRPISGMGKPYATSLRAMQRVLETEYGLGRLAFGVGLIAAPSAVGGLLLDERANEAAVRTFARSYGTRDTVLGTGMLAALATGADTRPWLVAGILSDTLDVVVQLSDWEELNPRKRVPGVLSAALAAAVGAWLLVRHD
jgi:hypothetical protein